MGKCQEVEVKHPLFNRLEVIDLIEKAGGIKKVDNQHQLDIYFCPQHKNFLENEIISEWLRIRRTNTKSTINYKKWLPVGEKIQTHCEEYETIINDAKILENILFALDFKEIIRVEKIRNSWILNEVEISIDFVNELGDFIELEAVNEIKESDISIVLDNFKELLSMLSANVGAQDRRGYPYLMIESKRGD